ncbi:MAG TPA: hypothetical protein VFZ66_19040 [Herpetosiphonaceae bacterium]
MTTLDRTPIPRIQPRKGFNWLPLEQQMSVFALAALLILAFVPMLIDTGRAGSGRLKQAMLRPRSVAGAVARLDRHYGLAWRTTGSGGEQRIRQTLLAVCCGVLLAGAAAGWKAQEPTAAPSATTAPQTTTPRRYGTASQIRARSAVAIHEEEDHG